MKQNPTIFDELYWGCNHCPIASLCYTHSSFFLNNPFSSNKKDYFLFIFYIVLLMEMAEFLNGGYYVNETFIFSW